MKNIISKIASDIIKQSNIKIKCDDESGELTLKIDKLAKGSSRIVFPLFDAFVLKFAFSTRGIAQNKTECRIYKSERVKQNGMKEFLAKITQFDEHNYKWMVVERCVTAEEKDFEEKFGIEFDELVAVLNWWKRGEEKPQRYDEYSEMDWFEPLKDSIEFFKLHIPDIRKMNAWGVNSIGELKLVDYGIDKEVWDKYYRDKVKKK